MANKMVSDMESALGKDFSLVFTVLKWGYLLTIAFAGLFSVAFIGFLYYESTRATLQSSFADEYGLSDYFASIIIITVFSLILLISFLFSIFLFKVGRDDKTRFQVVFTLSISDSEDRVIHLSDIHDIIVDNYSSMKDQTIKSINSDSSSFQTDTKPSSSFNSNPLVFEVWNKGSQEASGRFLLSLDNNGEKRYFTFYSREFFLWQPLKKTFETVGYRVNIVSKSLMTPTFLKN